MKYIPQSASRVAHRSLLKVKAKSPTILVVGGVVGLGVTAVMAARATTKTDPVMERFRKDRMAIQGTAYQTEKMRRQDVVRLYSGTAMSLSRIYGPTIILGSLSAASVLAGHNLLRKRHVATMLAYSGLAEEFASYRGRVAQTLGQDAEREIYDGAHGEWIDDPDNPGQQKRAMIYERSSDSYLRPLFDRQNINWSEDPTTNYLFLKGVQTHMNNLLQIRGHVFLNEVFDAIDMPRQAEAQVSGWVWNGDGDNYVDFGFLASQDPQAISFREGLTPDVQFHFNVDGPIWDKI